jgi:serine/threonine protein kinase
MKTNENSSLVGKRVKAYEINKILGESNFGITYLARNTETNELVVIKQTSLQIIDDWKKIELFEREIATLSKLDHPNIPRFIESFKTDDNIMFFVQKYISGKSLSDYPKITEQEAKDFLEQLCNILEYIHRQQIIHRDIKPKNIIVSENKIYLVDFGAVRKMGQDDFGSTTIGTLEYMPPEQQIGRAFPASDIYSLGKSIIEKLSGKLLKDMKYTGFEIEYEKYLHGISDHFLNILKKMVDPNIEKRYKNAREVKQDIITPPSTKKQNSINKSTTSTKRLIIILLITTVLGLAINAIVSTDQKINKNKGQTSVLTPKQAVAYFTVFENGKKKIVEIKKKTENVYSIVTSDFSTSVDSTQAILGQEQIVQKIKKTQMITTMSYSDNMDIYYISEDLILVKKEISENDIAVFNKEQEKFKKLIKSPYKTITE